MSILIVLDLSLVSWLESSISKSSSESSPSSYSDTTKTILDVLQQRSFVGDITCFFVRLWRLDSRKCCGLSERFAWIGWLSKRETPRTEQRPHGTDGGTGGCCFGAADQRHLDRSLHALNIFLNTTHAGYKIWSSDCYLYYNYRNTGERKIRTPTTVWW